VFQPLASHEATGSTRLVYDPQHEAWIGFVRLPVIEQNCTPAAAPPSESVEEILKRLDRLRPKLNELGEVEPRTAQDEFDDWDDDQRPTRQEVRMRVWDRWIGKLIWGRRADGFLCVRLSAPEETPPAPIQEQTVRHLIEHEAAIVGAIREALHRSCQDYGVEPSQALAARITSITIHNDGLNDIAPIRFGIECDWEIEHGMVVVYHPLNGAEWTTADSDFDLIAAACPEPPPAPPPTPEEDLVTAIFAQDRLRMEELLAQGVRAEPASGSALFGPIHARDVDQVRQLLAAGADPNRSDAYEGTPLQAARRALAEGTLTLPRRAPWWMKLIVLMPKLLNARAIRRERRNGEDIVRMLLDAGAK